VRYWPALSNSPCAPAPVAFSVPDEEETEAEGTDDDVETDVGDTSSLYSEG